MFTGPYQGISSEIRDVIERLLVPGDTYHQAHKRRLARTLQVFLDQDPQGRVLELGSEGFFPLAITLLRPDLDITVTNFNLEEDMVHEFSVSMNEVSGSFKAFAIDLESDAIPEPSESFDWVVCCEVLEHMDIDPMFMMSEINRVTKTDGSLLLTTPNIASSRGIAKIIRGLEPYFYMHYHKDRSPYRHNYEYSIHSLGVLLKASGFSGTAWTEDTFEDPYLEIVNKLRDRGFVIENIGDNIFSVSKKVSQVVDRHPGGLYV